MEAEDLHSSLCLLINIFWLIYESQKGPRTGQGQAAAAGEADYSSIYATRQNIPVPPQKPDQPRIHKSRLPRDGGGVA